MIFFMKTIKVGVIGAGGIAQHAHIPSYQKLESVELVAVADINEKKLDFVKNKFNIPHTFTNYKDLLAMDEIDAVSICTPNYLHKTMAIDAMMAGKHVICEKPICASGAAARELTETAARLGKVFMGAFVQRFSSNSLFLKKSIEAGEFGEIYYAKGGYIRRRGIPGLGGWFTTKACEGGCMADIGVHALDRMFWLMGSPKPVAVMGRTFQMFKDAAVDGGWPPAETRIGDIFNGTNDVDDMAQGYVKFENGATLFVEASWAGNCSPNSYIQLFGTKLGVSEEDSKVKIYGELAGGLTDTIPQVPHAEDGYVAELRHFTSCVRDGKAPLTTPEEIIAVSKIIEGIYKSSETGQEIDLSTL